MEPEGVAEGDRLRSATAAAPALAYGHRVLEPGRDVLLPVLISGRCEPSGGARGDSGVDDGPGCGVHLLTGEGALPDARPRIISDKGPQFMAKDFKEFIASQGSRT